MSRLPTHLDLPSPQQSNKAVLFIESRYFPMMLTILRKAFHHLSGPESGSDSGWSLICYIEQSVAKQYHDLFTPHFSNIHWIIFTNPDYNLTAYNTEFTTAAFWQQFPAKTLFILQYDTWVIGNSQSITDFLQYDYIGAPWFYYIYTQEQMGIDYPDWVHLIRDQTRCGGNGGFSIRNRDAMIDICQLPNLNRYMTNGDLMPEDIFFSINCYQYGKRLPPLDVATRFACEQYFTPAPFGIHRPFSLITWPDMFQYIFPELTPLIEESYRQIRSIDPIWYPYESVAAPTIKDPQWTVVNRAVFNKMCPCHIDSYHSMLTEYEDPLGITYVLRILLMYHFGGWTLNPWYTVSPTILHQIRETNLDSDIIAIYVNEVDSIPIAIYTKPKDPIIRQMLETLRIRLDQRTHPNINHNVGDIWISNYMMTHCPHLKIRIVPHIVTFHQQNYSNLYTINEISYLHTLTWRERNHELFEWIPIQNLDCLTSVVNPFTVNGYKISRLYSVTRSNQFAGWIHMPFKDQTLYQTFVLRDPIPQLYQMNRYEILTVKPYLASNYSIGFQSMNIRTDPVPANMAIISSNRTGRRVGFGLIELNGNMYMIEIDPLQLEPREDQMMWSTRSMMQCSTIMVVIVVSTGPSGP